MNEPMEITKEEYSKIYLELMYNKSFETILYKLKRLTEFEIKINSVKTINGGSYNEHQAFIIIEKCNLFDMDGNKLPPSNKELIQFVSHKLGHARDIFHFSVYPSNNRLTRLDTPWINQEICLEWETENGMKVDLLPSDFETVKKHKENLRARKEVN